ncbi:MAG: DUF3592 domain-containing protein [Bacteroidales bacterium]|jgi:hypothetical protein|nr:DUF3592 domain-containing protein [Bacteroidales bacterium]
MNKQQSIVKTLVFAAILFVMGFTSNKYIIKPLAEEAEASIEWPTTSGVITSSEMTKEWKKDEQDPNKGDYMYSAHIRYNYLVGGEEYSSTRIDLAQGSTSSQSSVEETLLEYAKGNTVSIYYNPESPNRAVLIPGASFGLKLLFKLPFVFAVAAVLMI